MVKRQKEKQYQSSREHRTNQQLRSGSTNAATVSNTSIEASTLRTILPFTHCAISLLPYEIPTCHIQTGIIVDQSILLEFLLQYKIDPITGDSIIEGTTSVHMKQYYIQLDMDINEEGKWQCPILTKPFNDRMKVVAIIQKQQESSVTTTTTPHRRTAKVYSYEAYHELNMKSKNYIDLLSGQSFDPNQDVIIIYDPTNNEWNRLRNSIHTKHNRNIQQTTTTPTQHSTESSTTTDKNNDILYNNKNNTNTNVRLSVTATRVMETIRKKQQIENEQQQKQKAKDIQEAIDDRKRKIIQSTTNDEDKDSNTVKIIDHTVYYNSTATNEPYIVLVSDVIKGGSYTTGSNGMASSFTSTAMNVSDTNTIRIATTEEILQSQFYIMKKNKKKGYVKLYTNYGNITIELHCDIVPRTCMNFLGLCRQHYYNNTIFHRLIKQFMIQGGSHQSTTTTMSNNNNNKTEVRKEDRSLWGLQQSFQDEFDLRLSHNTRGIVSMANSGPNTNLQQFFITFNACTHLDNKHSIFGIVIDGLSILDELEQISVKPKSHQPMTEIQIIRTEILVDPAIEVYNSEQIRVEQLIQLRHESNNKTKKSTTAATVVHKKMKMDEKEKSVAPPPIGRYLPSSLSTQLSSSSLSQQQQPQQKLTLPLIATATTTINNSTFAVIRSNNNATAATKSSSTTTRKFGNFSGW